MKIPKDFEYRYYRAVERGHAFNPMDALERVFRLRGIDKSDNDLYLQVVKFRDILLEKTVETSKEVGKEIFNQKNNTKGLVAGTICAIAGGIAFFASKKKED